jgi:hypothetical protein
MEQSVPRSCEEKESCHVCTEPFNKISHKKLICCFCQFESCHKCVQRYILNEIQDPSCMKCHKIWTREFVDTHLSKQFINNELKIHRENILFEKEKNLLPDTQYNVRLLHQQEEIDREIKSSEQQVEELQKRIEELERKRAEINPFQHVPRQVQYKNRIQCPVKDCRGFVEDIHQTFSCGICNTVICHSCREIVAVDHKCVPETVKTIVLLDSDTKRCPSCLVQIFKINGCDQMWCTSCHIAFDWKTGERVRGIIHNPHYHDYVEQRGAPIRRRESYQRFEFIDTDVIVQLLTQQECHELTIYQIIEVYRYVIHYYEVDLRRLPTRFDDTVNLDLRIHYLNKNITEEEFKNKLQRRQKDIEKKIEYRDIGETYVDIMNDIFISFLDKKNVEGLIHEIQTITKTTQEAMYHLNKRYNSNLSLVRTFL